MSTTTQDQVQDTVNHLNHIVFNDFEYIFEWLGPAFGGNLFRITCWNLYGETKTVFDGTLDQIEQMVNDEIEAFAKVED